MIKRTLLTLSLIGLGLGSLHADKPVALNELPAPVTKAIADYFPESKPISAKHDEGDKKYELKVQYKDLHLEVEVSAEGRILDLDLDKP